MTADGEAIADAIVAMWQSLVALLLAAGACVGMIVSEGGPQSAALAAMAALSYVAFLIVSFRRCASLAGRALETDILSLEAALDRLRGETR